MNGNDTQHTGNETGACPMRFQCPCGEMVADEDEPRGGELDLTVECDACGRQHVVTITEVQDPIPGTPIPQR